MWFDRSMHTITKPVRKAIQGMPVDAGTKAGIFKVYEHTGKLRSVKDLRQLSEHEQHWFSLGFADYMENLDHPARAMYASLHYGRVIYILSLIYYLSLITWITSLVNQSVEFHRSVQWSNAVVWLVVLSLLNIAFTLFGIHLERVSLKNGLNYRLRTLAFLVIIVLVIGIVSNIFAPYILDQHAAASTIFMSTSGTLEL